MTVCPLAAWKPVGNHGGPMSAQLGLVLHVQEGNNSLAGWFNNPTSGASSTYWVSKTGVLEQYVDCTVCAWAQGNGNSTYQSVESEGYTTEALTQAQMDTLAELYRWGYQTYGWANILAEAPGQPGFGWHGMGGNAWGGHTGCPGDLRGPQRSPILAAAFGGTSGGLLPPTDLQEDPDMIIIRMASGACATFDGIKKLGIPDPASLKALQDAGVKLANVSNDYWNKIPNA